MESWGRQCVQELMPSEAKRKWRSLSLTSCIRPPSTLDQWSTEWTAEAVCGDWWPIDTDQAVQCVVCHQRHHHDRRITLLVTHANGGNQLYPAERAGEPPAAVLCNTDAPSAQCHCSDLVRCPVSNSKTTPTAGKTEQIVRNVTALVFKQMHAFMLTPCTHCVAHKSKPLLNYHLIALKTRLPLANLNVKERQNIISFY